MKSFVLFCILCFGIIGCANRVEGEGNTIHNESVISPSISNNTVELGTSNPFGDSRSDTNLNIAYFKG